MFRVYSHRRVDFDTLFPARALLCPNAATLALIPDTLKTSEWVRKMFDFEPFPKQIEVLDTAAKYLILCCNRQWGKSTIIACKALRHAITVPKQSIVVLSRTKDQAGELIAMVTDRALQLGYPLRRVLGQRYSFKFPNGSKICAVPHNEDTSLGRTANILIIDEAARVKDKVYYAVSAFVAHTRGAIWMLSTPKRQTGFFYNYWHDKKTDWLRIFSNVHDCPNFDRDFLERRKAGDYTTYMQDFECKFVQPDDSLTTREFVESMLYTDDENRSRVPKL